MQFTTHDPAITRQWGASLAQLLQPGDIILLEGDLGAGKTTLTRGIVQGLGVTGYITSPTFTLVNEYKGRLPVYHLDCYRLESAREALNFGIEEYLYGEGVTIIEWAERIASILPAENLTIKLADAGENSRQLEVAGRGVRYQQLMRQLETVGNVGTNQL